uniref:Uncharacterized protein n=1 Tax=Timema tahoe TaxID=61484 RepID=A0A7R9IBP1_9NEOP|nr:unnamed protein product [Timema tahoe]
METGTPPSTPEPDRQKNAQLVNGGRDLDFVPEDSNLSAGEQDPCLPAANNSKPATITDRQPSTSKDEADNKQTLIGSNDSIGGKKKRNSYDRTRPKLASRIESRMRERTGLSRLGLIVAALLVFLLFIFLIVIIVLASTWPRKTHVELSPICRTSPCLMASAQVLKVLACHPNKVPKTAISSVFPSQQVMVITLKTSQRATRTVFSSRE